MKRQLFPFTLLCMLFIVIVGLACGPKKEVQQFSVVLTFRDGSKEAYAMYPGSVLYVRDGTMHVIAQAIKGTKDEFEMQITRYAVSTDTVKKESTVRMANKSTNKLALAKTALLDPAGTVHIEFRSMAMINTGKKPIGACNGICCEAKCFSTFCCSDPHECKDIPCDCKPPANCGQPVPDQTALLFEIFRSGKEVQVFKI